MSDNIDRLIGRMEGTLNLILESQNKADVGRKQLYEAVEALRSEIADYKRRLESAEKRLDELEKPVAELKKWRERAVGAIMLVSIVAATIGGALAVSWQKIMDVFR